MFFHPFADTFYRFGLPLELSLGFVRRFLPFMHAAYNLLATIAELFSNPFLDAKFAFATGCTKLVKISRYLHDVWTATEHFHNFILNASLGFTTCSF